MFGCVPYSSLNLGSSRLVSVVLLDYFLEYAIQGRGTLPSAVLLDCSSFHISSDLAPAIVAKMEVKAMFLLPKQNEACGHASIMYETTNSLSPSATPFYSLPRINALQSCFRVHDP